MARAILLILAIALVSGCASSPAAPPATPRGFVGRWTTVAPVTDAHNVAAGPMSLQLELKSDGTLTGNWTDKDGAVVTGAAGTWRAKSETSAVMKTDGSAEDGALELIDDGNLRIGSTTGATYQLRRVE